MGDFVLAITAGSRGQGLARCTQRPRCTRGLWCECTWRVRRRVGPCPRGGRCRQRGTWRQSRRQLLYAAWLAEEAQLLVWVGVLDEGHRERHRHVGSSRKHQLFGGRCVAAITSLEALRATTTNMNIAPAAVCKTFHAMSKDG